MKENAPSPFGQPLKHSLRLAALSIVISALVIAFISFLTSSLPVLSQQYGFVLILMILSCALLIPASLHVRSYTAFPCMTGMMIGMTVGMLGGVLIGFIVGMTNGMFYGSLMGMLGGMVLGAWNGQCCGIMGVMEGLMAGSMGGLMGAMTAVMTVGDHQFAMGVILFVVSLVIGGGLHLLVVRESRYLERRAQQETQLTLFFSALLTLVLTLFVLFGPRGGIFS